MYMGDRADTMNEKFFDLKKEKQDSMINAGLKLFALNGYHHASTDEIVLEARISKGLLFHYFGSKAGYYAFLFNYANRFTILELKSGIRDAAIDYFDLQRQILTQEIDIVRQYPYMLHFLESVKMETDKKGLAAIEAPDEVSDDYYEYLETEAQLGGYLRVMNAQHLSGMLYYVKMGLLRRYLSEPEFRPDAYKQEVLEYINTLQQMAAAL